MRTVADIVVAAVDKLSDADLLSLAKRAREAIFILCQKDLRRVVSAPERPLPGDAITARSLGWEIKRTSAEGVVLEKDGRVVALIDEPVMLMGSEDLVMDVVDRLSALGWRPLVAWRDVPRDPDHLKRLLDQHSLSLPQEDAFRAVVERFGLSRSALQSGEDLRHIRLRSKEAAEECFGASESSSLVTSELAQLARGGGGHSPLQTTEVIQSAEQKTWAADPAHVNLRRLFGLSRWPFRLPSQKRHKHLMQIPIAEIGSVTGP